MMMATKCPRTPFKSFSGFLHGLACGSKNTHKVLGISAKIFAKLLQYLLHTPIRLRARRTEGFTNSSFLYATVLATVPTWTLKRHFWSRFLLEYVLGFIKGSSRPVTQKEVIKL